MSLPETAVTRSYGIRLPIVAGGLMWLSDADYVAACAHAGIISFITAASFPDLADLRAEIARCARLCEGRPFGVNVSMLPKLVDPARTADTFRLIADAGVRHVETSGRNPEEFLPILKDAGITVLHKVPSVRYAQKAQSVGVDMVSIVGAECGGHPGMDMIGTMVNAALAEQRLRIPYLIGGGIGTGSQLVAALAMGAAGVVMGTRLLVADELRVHPEYKAALINATELDTALTLQSKRNTIRTLANETTRLVQEMEAADPDIPIADLMPHISGQIGRRAYQTGDVTKGLLSAGQALGLTHEAAPMADIIAGIEAEARAALTRLGGAA
ncbi:nitronate monooxygenase [Rubricella aquisinus]|uniref:Nitronate monooxygenase n=1 Tax=Rubricella aquisinus TaxID=2028108 RepID=A0A840WIY6_9RHOB|nr:nitronate monooxygenase [Rubricella aquisinus]MBB5514173.1 nitronate monooxygenase [Rubricella aquisinus]